MLVRLRAMISPPNSGDLLLRLSLGYALMVAASFGVGLSPGAPRGAKNGNFKNGDWTADAIEERRWLRSLVQSFTKNGTTE